MTAIEQLTRGLEQLTGMRVGPLSGDITVTWDDTAAVRRLVAASGLPVERDTLPTLTVTGPDRPIVVHTHIPYRELALVAAETAIIVDQRLATSQPLTTRFGIQALPGVTGLVDGLTRFRGHVRDTLTIHARQALDDGPFGHRRTPTPLADILATLMLDELGSAVPADGLARGLTYERTFRLVLTLVDDPRQLDVARGLARTPRLHHPRGTSRGIA